MKLKRLISYLLTENVYEASLTMHRGLEPIVREIKKAIEYDIELKNELANAESIDDIIKVLESDERISEMFGKDIQEAAQLIYVANLINTDVFNINEGFDEEKGYHGPKKYKKVVGSGKNKRTVRYGAKGYSIAPGTSKGDSYCARSYGQMKDHPSAAKDANSPLRLSRKKWRCAGKYSKK